MAELLKKTDLGHDLQNPFFRAYLDFFSSLKDKKFSDALNAGLGFYIKGKNFLYIELEQIFFKYKSKTNNNQAFSFPFF